MSQPPTPPISPPVFLDVPALLESSRPRRTVNWYWFVVGLICMLSLFDSFGSSEDAPGKSAVWLLSTLLIAGASIAAITQRVMIVRRLRAQQQTVDAIDEMMQLRRWEPAGILLDRFLSSPVRSGRLWTTALVQLASLLGRHHRFEDAIAVQDFLIENEMLDDQSDYFLRLGRAMAMLREDHLVDADRAISDLRRRGPQGGTGGLALVEMFRDVKTGHADEAIEIFSKSLPAMRQQLGNRVADAHVLAAKAYDLLGDEAQAKTEYYRATLLAPAGELQRRYPEVLKLAEKYPPAVAPKEAA